MSFVDFYRRGIKPCLPGVLQKFCKATWYLWGYKGIAFERSLPFKTRIDLIKRFLRVDFNVEHGHWPCEIAHICKVLCRRRSRPGEVMVEAGCWQGGSTAKFSILCKVLGYRLYVFDSFQGVEPTDQPGYDFSGEYRASQRTVRDNVRAFGEADVCSYFAGWFSDTLAAHPVRDPIAAVYIDCDLAKGTLEVLQGVMPSFAEDGILWSQDYHIEAVQDVLHDPATWRSFGKRMTSAEFICYCLARLRLEPDGTPVSSSSLREC